MPGFLPSIKWSRFPQSPFSPTRSGSTPLPPVDPSQESTEEALPRPLPGQLLVQNSSSTVALSSTPANGHSSQHQSSDAADPAVVEPHVAEVHATPATSILEEVNQADEMPIEPLPVDQSISPRTDVDPTPSVPLATAEPSPTPAEHLEETAIPQEAPAAPQAPLTETKTLVTPIDDEAVEKLNQEPVEEAEDAHAESAPSDSKPTSADPTSPGDIVETGVSPEATSIPQAAPVDMDDPARAAVIKAELLSPSSGDADKENSHEESEAADQSMPSPSEKKQKSKKNRFERMTSPLRSSGPQQEQHQEASPGLERALSGKRKNQVPIGDRLKGVLEQVKGKVKKDKEAVIYGKRLSRGELGV